MNRQQFFNAVKYLRLKVHVENGRVKFSGNASPAELQKALDEMPELEAELILREATRNPDLLDAIQERACIRWCEGASDSLYMAVLANFAETSEKIEYSDKPDEKQAAFLRRLGFSEAHIKDKEKCPSVWILRQPLTDWDAELKRYQ